MKNLRIRILHTVFSLEPGGLENGIVNVANALNPDRFEVRVCCLEKRGAFADRLSPGIGVTALGKRPGFSVATCWALRREIAQARPHLIHSHNLGPLIYSAIATLGGMTAPILQGEHAELTTAELKPARLRLRRGLYRCCRVVHSVGEGMHRQLAGLKFASSKLRVIVNGVDTARFAPPGIEERLAERRKIGISAGAFVVGMVGRFGPFKGHGVLIEAFERLADRNPSLHLLVVGGGGPREEAVREKVLASPHAGRILVAGFQRDPLPFYRAMDLLAVPSTNEGLSNAVLEAMACGVPVLGNRACGNSEVIGEDRDGLLADLSTSERIEEALSGVLATAGGLPEMGLAARQKIIAHFSLEKMVREYENIYSEIARFS